MTSKSNPGTNTSDTPSGLTVGQVTRRAVADLTAAIGSEGEARAMVRDIWEWLTGWNTTKVLLHTSDSASVFVESEFRRVTTRVIAGEPLQYVLGTAHFYGMTFDVTPDVLVPRPETAELVDFIVDDAAGRSDLNLLDIATGSGCIAIALARNLPFSHVEATDISAKALDVARANAARLRCNITFTQQDILTAKPPADPTFDIVVSNPPYVMNSEKAEMESRVIDHEPTGALFVPDSDPLKFYLAVAVYAESALKAGGRLYFELNPLTADELSSVLEKRGCWNDISIRLDSFGKKRMLRATLG